MTGAGLCPFRGFAAWRGGARKPLPGPHPNPRTTYPHPAPPRRGSHRPPPGVTLGS